MAAKKSISWLFLCWTKSLDLRKATGLSLAEQFKAYFNTYAAL
jgi:hypothetical protein